MIDISARRTTVKHDESVTQDGFYKASTHERTTDLDKMNPILEKININVPVEEELNEFRREIEEKYAEAGTNTYAMMRHI